MRPSAFLLASLSSALLLGFATNSEAGIYNMQSLLTTDAEEGLSGTITASADWRTGNTEYLDLAAAPVARYRDGNHLFLGVARAHHKSNKSDTLLSNFFEHLRYRYRLSDSLLTEVFAQHEYDAIKRLQLRALLGGGLAYSVAHQESFGLSVGSSYMMEYEVLQDDGASDAGVSDLQHRNSTYAIATYKLDDRVALVESAYLQPRLTDLADYRLQSESGMVFQISETLSFTTSFTIAYDSKPPDSIKKLDTTLKSAFTLQL